MIDMTISGHSATKQNKLISKPQYRKICQSVSDVYQRILTIKKQWQNK